MKLRIPYNALIWGLGAIVMGLLLLLYADNVVKITIRLAGILAITIGGIQLIVQIVQNRRSEEKSYPIGSIIAIIIGVILLLHTTLWSNFMIIGLGILMAFLGINQMISYRTISKRGIHVAGGYYIFPILLLIAGVFTVINPPFAEKSLTIFVAIWLLLYGIVELVSYFTLGQKKKEQLKKNKNVDDL